MNIYGENNELFRLIRGKVSSWTSEVLWPFVFTLIFPLFLFQDDLIEKEKTSYAISGGCCALAAIHLMGKLYVANSGDSRWENWEKMTLYCRPQDKICVIHSSSPLYSEWRFIWEILSDTAASCAPWGSLCVLQHHDTVSVNLLTPVSSPSCLPAGA